MKHNFYLSVSWIQMNSKLAPLTNFLYRYYGTAHAYYNHLECKHNGGHESEKEKSVRVTKQSHIVYCERFSAL